MEENNNIETTTEKIIGFGKDKVMKDLLNPVENLVDKTLIDITTSIGAFVIREIQGKYQRSISFTIGINYADYWMEQALYGILYKYNDIKKCRQLKLTNDNRSTDGSGLYYQLEDGNHNLKYRNYNILLNIQSSSTTQLSGRVNVQRVYTLITYNLSKQFVIDFERDMIAHRNSLLKIKKDSPTVSIYQDLHEGDGYTYWDKIQSIPKRPIGTIYLPDEQKKQLVDTINRFFAEKHLYQKYGVPHNLKILLYGPPGPQPVDTMIPTPDGLKRLGDIQPSDYVIGDDGNPIRVEEVIDYANMDVWEISFMDGRKVKCGADHKWPILSLEGKILERTTLDIYKRLEENRDFSYEMPKAQVCKFNNRKKINGYNEALKICNQNNTDISDDILYSTEDIRLDFAQTMMKINGSIQSVIHFGDGTMYRGEFYHFSSKVIYKFLFILRSLGFSASKIDDNKLSFKVIDKENRNLKDPGSLLSMESAPILISWVEKLDYKCNMRCLHVANESHIYYTEDFIPTFNSGKDSIAKMIASEWNRNIYYVTGGQNGKFIPNALTDSGDDVNYPLFIISDIDKYPYLINEADINMDGEGENAKEEKIKYKQLFGNMINALDGILSGDDRVIIMTTNHIEKFSEAFLRPGRINLSMEIGYVTPQVFRKCVWEFYHVELPKDIKLKSNKLTVAMLQSDVLFMRLSIEEFLDKYLDTGKKKK